MCNNSTRHLRSLTYDHNFDDVWDLSAEATDGQLLLGVFDSLQVLAIKRRGFFIAKVEIVCVARVNSTEG